MNVANKLPSKQEDCTWWTAVSCVQTNSTVYSVTLKVKILANESAKAAAVLAA